VWAGLVTSPAHPARSPPSPPLAATRARMSAPLLFPAEPRLSSLLSLWQRGPACQCPLSSFFFLPAPDSPSPVFSPPARPPRLWAWPRFTAPPGPIPPHRTPPRTLWKLPELGWGRAATARGMRGIRWLGDPHAETAQPSSYPRRLSGPPQLQRSS
jgi:hypothetical protein